MSEFQRENRGGQIFTAASADNGDMFFSLGNKDKPMRPAFEIKERDRFSLAAVVVGKNYDIVPVHEEHQWKVDGSCAYNGCKVRRALEYPYAEGEVTVLGPEIFSSTDAPTNDTVINWRGENFTAQPPPRELLIDPANQANVGDIVEIEAKDEETWSVRGMVYRVERYAPEWPLLITLPQFADDHIRPVLRGAYVYRIRRTEDPEFAALKAVFASAQDAVEDDDGGYMTDDLIRELARRKVRVVDE